jgi:hypothetical protein
MPRTYKQTPVLEVYLYIGGANALKVSFSLVFNLSAPLEVVRFELTKFVIGGDKVQSTYPIWLLQH